MGCSQTKPPPKIKGIKEKKHDNAIESKCKVVLIGNCGVGKSAIAQKFVKGIFNEAYKTTIAAIYLEATVQVSTGNNIKLLIWDTSGEEKFRAMQPMYYRDSLGVIIVYDISDPKSFENLDYWVGEVEQTIKKEEAVIFIVGNKCDLLDKQVETVRGRNYANSKNFLFYEVSAKSGDNINELFKNLAENINKLIKAKKSNTNSIK